ncbi:MAG: hypothetical protein Q8N47_05455 [Bryobacterales bacterium]|nr:hypothetical protein [Bryobacterales bacterium]
MRTISTRRAGQLGDAARNVLESLLGRTVGDEEHITVMAHPPQPPLTEDDRRTAAQALAQNLDTLASRARHIPEQEMEALIDEAMEHVRPRRP